MTKNTPFVPVLHVFAPLNDVHEYNAWSWKTTLISEFLDEPDTPLDIRVPPRAKSWIKHGRPNQSQRKEAVALNLMYPPHFEDVQCQSGVNYIYEG